MCPIKFKKGVKIRKNWAYRGEKFYVPNKVSKRSENQKKIGYIQEKSSMCPIKSQKGVKIRKKLGTYKKKSSMCPIMTKIRVKCLQLALEMIKIESDVDLK